MKAKENSIVEYNVFLAKYYENISNGPMGEHRLYTYKGERLVCYNGNLSKDDIKLLRSKWHYIQVESINGKHTYKKAILCSPDIARLMIAEDRRRRWEEEQAKKRNKGSTL